MTGVAGGQPFSFGIADTAIAEAGGVPLDALHYDVDAICRSYDRIRPVAERLGVAPPVPRLAGFCYAPLAGLGATIVFPPGSEPIVKPMIHSAAEIDDLREPTDYMAGDLTQSRLATVRELVRRRPDASIGIGHGTEGPVTAAVLIMGQEFLTLPYDDPGRAHRLLGFATRAMVHYVNALGQHMGTPPTPGPRGFPDDFAGMFPPAVFKEFVVPYWEQLYQGLQATQRSLHSELLRVEHLPLLADLRVADFDPSADQYLTPEMLRDHCPCRFSLRILSWHVHDLSASELETLYRRLAGFSPSCISLTLSRLADQPKLARLLAVARELAEAS